jgi:hypothetical protein
MSRIASCSCGQLKVTCRGEPHRISMCHCLACQRRTGSVFGVQARFRSDEVTIGGRATAFERVGDEGGRITFHFCPVCGSTVYYVADFMPGAVAVAVGAFAEPSFPAPTLSFYESRRHPWAAMAGLEVEHSAD